MSGKHSRDKGARAEREIAKILGAVKVSGMYTPGPDLIWRGYPVEVKIRKEPISKTINKLLRDAPIVVERADRGEWVAHLRVTDLLDLLDEQNPRPPV